MQKKALTLKQKTFSYTVWISVASPDKPRYNLSEIWKIFSKSKATVWSWTQYLKSDAIATQSLPFIATRADPL